MRYITFTIVATVLIASLAFSDTATQTDWSGGAGIQGPVLDWGDTFHTTDGNLSIIGGIMLKLGWKLNTPQEHTVDGNFEGARSVFSTDIDGDGDADVLGGAYYAGDNIVWWENTDGIGTAWSWHLVDGDYDGVCSVYSTDVDGDGDADVLGAAYYADEITWWENKDGMGTSWSKHVVGENFNGAMSVYAADVDGDGDMDVLGVADYANEVAWWENTNGSGTSWTEHTVDGAFEGPRSVYSTDVDGDGDADVLGAAYQADEIVWWENTDGMGTAWTEHYVQGGYMGAWCVHSADVDGDGDADVLGAAANADDIDWWENTDGTGTAWIRHNVDPSFDGAYSVYCTDVDADGDKDVLGAAHWAGEIAWWENTDGMGTAWTEHLVDGNFDEAMSVYSTDVDGDGYADVLGAAYLACDISWWKLSGFAPTGILESSILDLDRLPEWDCISWTSTEPQETSVGIQLRSSQSYADMGEWSDTVFTSGTSLSGIINDSTQYVQYRLILETENPAYSPLLEEISISFLELITVLSPNKYTIWLHGWENVILAWEYEADKSFQPGDSVSIELFKGDSLIADLTGGNVPNTGQFTYPGPIPTDWEPGLDYYVIIEDDADNHGSSDQFEIRVGIAFEEESSPSSAILLAFSPNPVQGTIQASIAVPETGLVELSVYDITGRVVRSSSGVVEAGYHNISLGELNQGIYFCRMIAEEYTGSQRFVVIK